MNSDLMNDPGWQKLLEFGKAFTESSSTELPQQTFLSLDFEEIRKSRVVIRRPIVFDRREVISLAKPSSGLPNSLAQEFSVGEAIDILNRVNDLKTWWRLTRKHQGKRKPRIVGLFGFPRRLRSLTVN